MQQIQIRTWQFIPCFFLFLAVGTASADDKTLSPYFFVDGGDPKVDRLPLKDTSVNVNVSGVIADVKMTQTYENEGTRPISARYVFPASTRAAVYGMTMTVGDVVIRAKVKEKEEARRDYEEAKAEGKNASLLEQERPNVFTMNVANVMPGQTIKVELSYTELLVPEAGTYEFVYPTVVGPRYGGTPAKGGGGGVAYTHAGVAPTSTFSLRGRVAAGLPVAELASSSHTLAIESQSAQETSFALENPSGNKDVILRYRLAGSQIQSGLMLFEGAREKFFLLMVQPPKRVEPHMIPPREYVFVVDVSGSMSGYPLDTSKALLRDLLGNLRPTDKFNVILFSGDAQIMSPTSLEVTKENIALAEHVIDNQRGGGGTELLHALKQAIALPTADGWSRHFVVITDGYISADREAMTYIRQNLGKASMSTFGIGTGVNRYLIEGLAKAGMGHPFVAESVASAKRQAKRLREYIEMPVLTNVRVATEGFRAYAIEPASVPDVLAERPVIVFGKWSGARRGSITVRGVTGKGTYEKTFNLADTAPSSKNRALSYLWARERLSQLSDFGDAEAHKQEIIDLGLAYNLLTRYTSFIAVYDKVVNDQDGDDVDQPLPLPEGVSDEAIGMEVGTEPSLVVLLGVLLMLAWVTRRRWAASC